MRWRDDTVNLGAFGSLVVYPSRLAGRWEFALAGLYVGNTYPTRSEARRAATRWLKRALLEAHAKAE